MLSNKEKTLVQYLLQNRGEYTTSKVLAEVLSCSDRTIRTYIKSIMDQIDSLTGVELFSKQGKGYRLEFSDEKSYQAFLKQFGNSDYLFAPIDTSDINDRHNYILNKLLLEQKELYFDDLVERLYVSRSTLSNDFKKIRQDLEKYDLNIESRPNRGVYIQGDERHIRRFIMDYFFNSTFFQTLYQYVNEEFVYGNIHFEALTIIILDECREAKLKLSDFVIQNLVVHIALAIRRLAEGFQISEIESNLTTRYPKEYGVATNILNRISKVTRLAFPEAEVAYITLHLIAKCQTKLDDAKGDLTDIIRKELMESLKEVIPAHLQYVKQDFQLVEGLLTHLITLHLRLVNHIVLENPLLEDIKENYLAIFQLSKQVLQYMQTFSKYDLSDDEIAYVALHFMAAKERHHEKHKYNVLVICATGYGSAQMLRSRIEKELGQYVHISDVIGYYEINDEKLKGIDFIISSVDLSNLIFSVPVFTTSVFLKEKELKEIRQQLEELSSTGGVVETHSSDGSSDFEALFDAYFSPDYFYINRSEGAGKEEVLNELVVRLGQKEDEQFITRMLEMMVQREQLSSVIFSDTIAVPHPIKPVASQLKVGVAIIPSGLYWEDDFSSIKLIFLPALSSSDNDGLKVISRAIVDLVDRPDIQEQLLHCQTFKEFRDIFTKANKRREL